MPSSHQTTPAKPQHRYPPPPTHLANPAAPTHPAEQQNHDAAQCAYITCYLRTIMSWRWTVGGQHFIRALNVPGLNGSLDFIARDACRDVAWRHMNWFMHELVHKKTKIAKYYRK